MRNRDRVTAQLMHDLTVKKEYLMNFSLNMTIFKPFLRLYLVVKNIKFLTDAANLCTSLLISELAENNFLDYCNQSKRSRLQYYIRL